MPKNEETRHFISPEQLCIGLFIHLDLAWLDHPFTFSSFKIKSQDQVHTLQRLGLQKIRYSPAKSDRPPLSSMQQAAQADMPEKSAPAPALTAEEEATITAKHGRQARMQRQRAMLAACEKDFVLTARTVRGLDRAIFSRPRDSALAGERLINRLADSMMTDKDITIHLMNDRTGGEDLYYHSLNVALLAMILAKEGRLGRREIVMIGMAALFHDVGKTEIPDRILLKEEPLNRSEQALYEQHVEWGLNAGRKAELSGEILTAIAQHHELCDGSGFPRRLRQDAISPLGRALALVDRFDHLCNHPALNAAMTPHEALAHIFTQQRSQYDAQFLKTFVRCMGVYPPGSLVMLSDDSYAMVVSVNSSRPLKPQLLVHVPDCDPAELPLIDLEMEPEINISKSLKPSQLPREALESLNPRKRTAYYFAPKDDTD